MNHKVTKRRGLWINRINTSITRIATTALPVGNYGTTWHGQPRLWFYFTINQSINHLQSSLFLLSRLPGVKNNRNCTFIFIHFLISNVTEGKSSTTAKKSKQRRISRRTAPAGWVVSHWLVHVRTHAAQQGFRTFSALIQSQTRDTSWHDE